MFRFLFLLFLIVPAIEIALFIQIGGMIGILATLFMIVLTAVLGAGLLRWQGLATMLRVQQRLAQGQLPAMEMIEGLMLLISGAFLLTPGFFTDALGFAVLVPVIRQAAARWLAGHIHLVSAGRVIHSSAAYQNRQDRHTIEGEYQRKDE